MTYTEEFTGWLVLSQRVRHSYNSGTLSARLTTNRPALDADEIAVKVTVRVPRSTFTRPALEAIIEVSDTAVLQPEVTVEEPGL